MKFHGELRISKKKFRFGSSEARKQRRFVISSDCICLLDRCRGGGTQFANFESAIDRLKQLQFEGFVVEADRGFEGADQIADDIFRGVMQQRREKLVRCEVR